MALVLKDRVKQQSTTTGTGTVTLGAAYIGYGTFPTFYNNGDEIYYTISNTATGVTEWEVGIGTFNSAGPTLSRDTVLSSTNSGSLVDFASGIKEVFVTYPAEKAIYADEDDNVTISDAIHFTPIVHPATTVEGSLFYDSVHSTLNYNNDVSGINFEIGENEYIRVYNNTGSTLNKGKPVTFSGINADVPTVVLCNATSASTYQVDGLVTEDIDDASFGYITISGIIRDFDTSGLTAGQRIFVGLTDGALTNTSPSYPNYPMCVGYTLKSGVSDGELVVIPQNHSVPNFRIGGDVYITNDAIIDGDLTVNGTQTVASTTNISTGAPFFYLASGNTIGEANTTFTGSGLDDAYYTGHFSGTSAESYYVRIDGTGTPDTFEWSKDDFATTEATGVSITGENQLLDNNINILFATTTGHTLNDKWSGDADITNVDTGVWSNRNTGTSGVGYTHIGMWFDVTDNKWKFTNAYEPEPEGSIDTGDASYVGGIVVASTFEGALSGNATTATAWQTGRTITLTGDVAGTSGSFNGTGNLSFATTIQPNSVTLGTDTTGNYVTSITNGTYITGGDGGSESAALTLDVDATSANTASKIVARDGSGNFSAGTITASLSGNASTVTNGVVTTGSYANPSWITSLDDGKVLPSMTGNSGEYLTTDGTNSSWAAVPSPNNGTLSLSTSGNGLSGSATFTADQAGGSTFTVTSNATNANTANAIVSRDASGNFSAGTITAALSGNASTVTNGVVTTGSYADPAWITSLDDAKVLPSMTGNSGEYLTTDGTNSSWATLVSSQWTTSGSNIYYTTGNVGIGTASPIGKLHVNGAIVADSNAGNGYAFERSGVKQPVLELSRISADVLSLINPLGNSLALGTNNTERMRIDSSGSVCIGSTSAPSTTVKLDVSGAIEIGGNKVVDNLYVPLTSGTMVLRGSNIAGMPTYTSLGNATTLGVISSYADSTASYARFLDISVIGSSSGTGTMRFLTGSTTSNERMRIDSLGNVGIGTTNPNSKTEIVGLNDGGEAELLQIRNNAVTTGTTSVLRFVNSTVNNSYANGGFIKSIRNGSSDSDLSFGTVDTERMRIDSAGNVGIGTSSPGGKLDIASPSGYFGSSNPILNTQYNSIQTFKMYLDSNWYTHLASVLVSEQTNGLAFDTSGAERMRITSTGNVGIGTSSPTSKLDVNGTVSATAFSGNVTGNVTGNASTATTLQTARTINGVSFNGSANITVTANTPNTLTRGSYLTGSNFNGSAATTWAVDASTAAAASKIVARDASGYIFAVYYNSAGTFSTTGATSGMARFTGTNGADTYGRSYTPAAAAAALSGQTMNIVGSSTSCTGNATTATTLQNARTINGVSFNGSANITVEPFIEGDDGTNATRYMVFTDNSTGGFKRLNEDSSLTYNPSTGNLTTNGTVSAGSDERWKEDWKEFGPNFIDELSQVKHGTYSRIDTKEIQVGVGAQSLQKVIPEAVNVDDNGYLNVAYGHAALASVVELAKEVVKLRAEITELKSRSK